jgi:hypothetical protein
VELPLRHLFNAPTIAELAKHLEAVEIERSHLDTIQPIPRTENLPLSFAQQRLWFLDQLVPNSAFYNISQALRLNGSLNLTALEQSLSEIVQRHESLRTTFVAVEGTTVPGDCADSKGAAARDGFAIAAATRTGSRCPEPRH